MTPDEEQKWLARFTALEALGHKIADQRDALAELVWAAMGISTGDVVAWEAWRARVIPVMKSFITRPGMTWRS